MIPTKLGERNEVGYQHECQDDPSAGPEGAHEGQPETSVDPDTSLSPSRLVSHLIRSASKPTSKLIYLQRIPRSKSLFDLYKAFVQYLANV